MMAGDAADGNTIIENAAREPKSSTSPNASKMGAKIQGAGSEVIRSEGVERLRRPASVFMPDRRDRDFPRRRRGQRRRVG